MKKFGTGAQSYPLSTGNNSAPTLTQGEVTTFLLSTVPDRSPTGPLAYVLPFLLLTIYGTVAQAGTGGSRIYADDLLGAVLDNINWSGTFFGSPVSANYVFGRNMAVSNYILGGYRFPTRQRPAIIGTAAATYPFRLNVLIPAASLMLGGLMNDTAQLARLFRDSQVDVKVGTDADLAALSTGATFGTLTARCSAIVYPTTELVLGTPVETVLHTIASSPGSNQVTINGFGRATQITGVKKKGGVVYLGELTSEGQQGGVFAAEDVTQFAMPWRGQIQQKHIEALIAPALMAMPNSRPQTLPRAITGGDSEFANFPYSMDTDDSVAVAAMDEIGLRIFPMVYGDNDLQLADLQTADQDEDYFLDVNGGFDEGQHQILGIYAKEWEQSMRDAWVAEMVKGDDKSLAALVLGKDRYKQAVITQRLPSGRHTITGDQMTYLPWQLA